MAAGFFQRFPITGVSSAELDAELAAPGTDETPALTVLFLWGEACPNCEVAKRAMLAEAARLAWPGVRWLHCNVYDDAAMATRFSLHGIPVFMVLDGRRAVGRVTGWPGTARFADAIERQLAVLRGEAG